MEKFLTSAKWKTYLRRRQRKQAASDSRFRDYTRHHNLERAGTQRKRSGRNATELVAPSVVSFLNNPLETIRFLNRITVLSADRNVVVNLRDVTAITPDAIAGLIAAINSESVNARISGNLPADAEARRTIELSGFRDHVDGGWVPKSAPIGNVRRRTLTAETVETKYSQAVTTELIAFATEKLRGRASFHQATYSVLGEAMLNTLNHASKSKTPQPWWASVFYDQRRQRACFTFIDQGLGIFKSHQLTTFLKLSQRFRLLSNADILERILMGEVRSSTGTPGRGNGLPGMYVHCKAGRIRNLTILTNDAIGKVEEDSFRPLASPFHGTLLYWEIEA